jgi:hypothetical protein
MTTTAAVMKIVKRTDRNTRALAKVVSAIEYLRDAYTGFAEVTEAIQELEDTQFDIIQERRNLRVALWAEMKKQS